MKLNIAPELRKFVTPELIFGIDARLLVGRFAKNLGLQRCFLVSDTGVTAAGWTGEIETILQSVGIETVNFTELSSNPRDYEVMNGAALFRETHCESLIAVGGGSVIDAAKGIGIVASNGGHILNFEGVDRISIPMPPLICIPTTGGTSADVSQFAIFTDTTDRTKIAIISKAVIPDITLIDPTTLLTMDPYVAACTGMDSLSHGIEAYVSNASSPLTDIHALEAIRLISTHLRASIDTPTDIKVRSDVMLGSLQAGLAFSNASLGAVHAMAHSLGGYKDLSHGECNALLLPHVIDYNFDRAPERFRQIAHALNIPEKGIGDSELRRQLIDFIVNFRKSLGIEGALAGRGILTSDIGVLSRNAIRDPCNATNPRPPSAADLAAIFEEAL